jgi:hypothetical protein
MQSKTFAIGLALILGTLVTARAQVYTGSIWGKVTDPTGGVLPGVTVTLASDRLIQPETTLTSENGTYRFAELPIGTYELTFELAGFNTLVRRDIILDAGATMPVIVGLELSSIEETVVVSGESPVVDVRQTGTPQTFNQDRLENIPTARDPWVLLEQTPGVLVNQQNVGGNESGSQSGHMGRGSLGSQNSWNYDGVDTTDLAATGYSSTYYDFGAFQELNITTSGQNPRLQTPGNAVSIVVKQATNTFRGQAAVYGTHHALQSSNIDDELREQGAGAGTPLKNLLFASVDAGGPIVKDRAWIWAGFGYQDIHRGVVGFLKEDCDDPNDVECLQDNPFELNHINIKANFQLSPNNKLNVLLSRNQKKVPNRGAGVYLPSLETTVKQDGTDYLFKLEDTHIVSSELLLTGRLAYFDPRMRLEFQDPALRDVQPTVELSTFTFGRSAGFYIGGYDAKRPSLIANFDGNYFLAGRGGGDHEMQFGFQFRKFKVEELSVHGGDAVAVFLFGRAREAWFLRPGNYSFEITNTSLHFQDIFTRDRWSLKLGLRFDYQSGSNRPSQIPANMVIPDIMPAVEFPGTDPINTWKNLSPRLGLTYDLTGDAKTLLRAGYSRYYSRRGASEIIFDNAAYVSELDCPWTDLNGDQFVQANEVDTSTILDLDNFDPANPDALVSPNEIDPNYTAPVTDELLVGMERELIPDFAVGVSYIYRNASNWVFREPFPGGVTVPYVGVSADDFVPVTFEFEGQELTYYELPFPRPAGEYLTNRPDYRQRYQAVELTGRKRLSNRWMLGFGVTFADHRELFDSEAAVFDPTNVDKRRGEHAITVLGRATGLNSRWIVKLDGMVQLPAGVNLAGKLNGRQGYVFPRAFWTPPRGGGIGRATVLLNPPGVDRYDDFWIADLRLEKTFHIKGTRLSGMLDIFNLFNAATVLARERRQNRSNANRVTNILAPRVLRIGVRWVF